MQAELISVWQVSIDPAAGTVTLRLTPGRGRRKRTMYLSTEASAETPAALEESTFAPAMNLAKVS